MSGNDLRDRVGIVVIEKLKFVRIDTVDLEAEREIEDLSGSCSEREIS